MLNRFLSIVFSVILVLSVFSIIGEKNANALSAVSMNTVGSVTNNGGFGQWDQVYNSPDNKVRFLEGFANGTNYEQIYNVNTGSITSSSLSPLSVGGGYSTAVPTSTTASSLKYNSIMNNAGSFTQQMFGSSPNTLKIGEYVATTSSQLYNKAIEGFTMRLHKVGNPQGTITIAIFDSNFNVKTSLGTMTVGILTTTPTDYTFGLSSPVTLALNDILGISVVFTTSDASNYLGVQYSSNSFDGVESVERYYTSSAFSDTSLDLRMLVYSISNPISRASDGNTATNYISDESAGSDYIYGDLGSTKQINNIKLYHTNTAQAPATMKVYGTTSSLTNYIPYYLERPVTGFTDLYSATNRVGVKLTSGSTVIGKAIDTASFKIYKNGSPTGTLNAVIRDVSNNVIATSTNTITASTVTTTPYTWYTFNFASPVTLQQDYRVLIESTGGSASSSNTIRVLTYKADNSIGGFDGSVTIATDFTSGTSTWNDWGTIDVQARFENNSLWGNSIATITTSATINQFVDYAIPPTLARYIKVQANTWGSSTVWNLNEWQISSQLLYLQNTQSYISNLETDNTVFQTARDSTNGRNIIAKLNATNNLSVISSSTLTSSYTPKDIVQSTTKLYTALVSGANLYLGVSNRDYTSYSETSAIFTTVNTIAETPVKAVVYDGTPDSIYVFVYSNANVLRVIKYTSAATTTLATTMTHNLGSDYSLIQLFDRIIIQTSSATYQLLTSTDSITQIHPNTFNTFYPQTFAISASARTFSSDPVYIANSTYAVKYTPSNSQSAEQPLFVSSVNSISGTMSLYTANYLYLPNINLIVEIVGNKLVMNQQSGASVFGIDVSNIPLVAQKFITGSIALGKKIDTIKLWLNKNGSPTGTYTVGAFNSAGNIVKQFGSGDASTLPTSSTMFTFSLTGGDTYTINTNERIGIKFASGSASNNVYVSYSTSDVYDTTKSHFSYYSGAWADQTGNDLKMVLDTLGSSPLKKIVGTTNSVDIKAYTEKLNVPLIQNNTLFTQGLLKMVCESAYSPPASKFIVGNATDCQGFRVLGLPTDTVGREVRPFTTSADLVSASPLQIYSFQLQTTNPENYMIQSSYLGKTVDSAFFDSAGQLSQRYLYGQCYQIDVMLINTGESKLQGNVCANNFFTKTINLNGLTIPSNWTSSGWNQNITRVFGEGNNTNSTILFKTIKLPTPYDTSILTTDSFMTSKQTYRTWYNFTNKEDASTVVLTVPNNSSVYIVVYDSLGKPRLTSVSHGKNLQFPDFLSAIAPMGNLFGLSLNAFFVILGAAIFVRTNAQFGLIVIAALTAFLYFTGLLAISDIVWSVLMVVAAIGIIYTARRY